jgi:RNA polymerase-binding transcription factor DksA
MDNIEAKKSVKNAFKSGNKEHLAEAIREYYKSVNYYRKNYEPSMEDFMGDGNSKELEEASREITERHLKAVESLEEKMKTIDQVADEVFEIAS